MIIQVVEMRSEDEFAELGKILLESAHMKFESEDNASNLGFSTHGRDKRDSHRNNSSLLLWNPNDKLDLGCRITGRLLKSVKPPKAK